MIALISAGVLLGGGLIFLLYYLFSGGGYDKEMMAYMPSDSAVLIGGNVEEAMDIDAVKDLVQTGLKNAPGEVTGVLTKAGFKIENISKVLVGITKNGQGGVLTVRFKDKPEPKKIADAVQAKEDKHKDKTFYKGPTGAFFFPSDDLLVGAMSEDALKKLIEKEGSDIAISEDLNKLAKKVAKNTFWVATTEANNSGFGGFGKMGGGIPGIGAGSLPSDAKGIALGVKITSSKLSLQVTVQCKDSDEASKRSDDANKQLPDAKKGGPTIINAAIGNKLDEAGKTAIKEAIESIDVGSSGDLLTISASIDYRPFLEKLKGNNLLQLLK